MKLHDYFSYFTCCHICQRIASPSYVIHVYCGVSGARVISNKQGSRLHSALIRIKHGKWQRCPVRFLHAVFWFLMLTRADCHPERSRRICFNLIQLQFLSFPSTSLGDHAQDWTFRMTDVGVYFYVVANHLNKSPGRTVATVPP